MSWKTPFHVPLLQSEVTLNVLLGLLCPQEGNALASFSLELVGAVNTVHSAVKQEDGWTKAQM